MESTAELTCKAVLSTVDTAKLSAWAAANYSHSSSASEVQGRTLGLCRHSTTSGKKFTNSDIELGRENPGGASSPREESSGKQISQPLSCTYTNA